MFLHGREAYRRNSYVVLYMFYKNVLLVLPIFYFGIYSEFSGTLFYGTLLYQGYNIILTAWPILWYGCFDLEHTKEEFMT
jgi:phospholipid-transporting ATPase